MHADGIVGAQAQGQLNNIGLSAGREYCNTIIQAELDRHTGKALAWNWLKSAIENHPPTQQEEAALWDLLCRARSERY